MHDLSTIKRINGEFPPDVPDAPDAGDPVYDVAGAIIAYEMDELDLAETLELFQHLVDTGLAWSLQGSYGRMAMRLINAGQILEAR